MRKVINIFINTSSKHYILVPIFNHSIGIHHLVPPTAVRSEKEPTICQVMTPKLKSTQPRAIEGPSRTAAQPLLLPTSLKQMCSLALPGESDPPRHCNYNLLHTRYGCIGWYSMSGTSGVWPRDPPHALRRWRSGGRGPTARTSDLRVQRARSQSPRA